jgi:hypothetical protein
VAPQINGTSSVHIFAQSPQTTQANNQGETRQPESVPDWQVGSSALNIFSLIVGVIGVAGTITLTDLGDPDGKEKKYMSTCLK